MGRYNFHCPSGWGVIISHFRSAVADSLQLKMRDFTLSVQKNNTVYDPHALSIWADIIYGSPALHLCGNHATCLQTVGSKHRKWGLNSGPCTLKLDTLTTLPRGRMSRRVDGVATRPITLALRFLILDKLTHMLLKCIRHFLNPRN